LSDKSPCTIHPHSKHTWGECNANSYKSKASGSNNNIQSRNKASAGPSAHVAQLSETASASDEDVYCNNIRIDVTNGSDPQSHTYDCICEYPDSRVLLACKDQQHSHVCSSHFTVCNVFKHSQVDLAPTDGIVHCFGTEIMKATQGKASKVTRFAKPIISKDRKTKCSGTHRSPTSILKNLNTLVQLICPTVQ
jgi:hypothetical protein